MLSEKSYITLEFGYRVAVLVTNSELSRLLQVIIITEDKKGAKKTSLQKITTDKNTLQTCSCTCR